MRVDGPDAARPPRAFNSEELGDRIAKATGQQLTEKTFFTEVRPVIVRPEYMRPEQAALTGQASGHLPGSCKVN